ncbi:hypothetical protein DI396_13405 [Litorivita pollutaquae]|uniref:Uncharacterized protein n=1 Tax=Litorivita pollutaquae TaxID=2200892 RepID=A0A2V4NKI9_9RHOB|nr:enoyl-CoA hydratase/isomerase family protein [Litorivita pollutaquae]PYC46717.1 hypothetical protein DI396_13405 [Litorivita pollutaquae]
MSGLLSYQCRDGVAILTIQNPPVNALTLGVRKGLMLGVEHALGDETARAVVIHGNSAGGEGQFSAGIDLSEYDHPLRAPWLAGVCSLIEQSSKPVVAVLEGRVLGAAFELALACHGRVAGAQARIGLPDIALGLSTGSGGATRAARLAGAGAALDLLLTGGVIGAASPEAQPFVDQVTKTDPMEAAIEFAKTLAATGGFVAASAREDGVADPAGYIAAVRGARAGFDSAGEDDPAAGALIAAVEAAQLLPSEAALAFEAAQFDDVVSGARSASLRHLYAAERRAAGHISHTTGPTITTLSIVGRGAAAAGVAVAALDAGMQVILVDPGRAAQEVQKTGGDITRIYGAAVQAGRLASQARQDRLERLKISDDPAVMRAGDIAVLIPIGGDDGAALVTEACQHMPEGRTIVTLGRTPDGFGDAVGARSADLVGVLFDRAAHLCMMGELAVPQGTAPDAEAGAVGLLRRMHKIAVGTRGDLFLSQALLLGLRRAGDEMLALGVSPYAIDTALRAAGIGQGIYAGLDAAGLRAAAYLAESAAEEGGAQAAVSPLQNALIAADRLGHSTGAGFYRYEGGMAQPDGEVLDLHRALLAQDDAAPTQMPAAQIVARAEAALVLTAARLLQSGAALAAGDLDVVSVRALGYRRALGGPLHHANTRGVYRVAADMRRFAKMARRPQDQAFWAPCDLLVDMVKNGRRFEA